jgi:hypothetical protein
VKQCANPTSGLISLPMQGHRTDEGNGLRCACIEHVFYTISCFEGDVNNEKFGKWNERIWMITHHLEGGKCVCLQR